ncbi:alpha/beta fold hydrolase [Sorangium sp. So ce1099]|uniref:alpha/beta fold hydrolase n=1 Tax=Sorangium sp. So ce1099 TaxID=3133331 RepID=UPI003F6147AA
MTLRRPEDFHHQHVQLADIRLHYVREGSGAPLVLLHGWPGFWWEWHQNIGPLAESFDVVAPDMRGYGDSEKPDLSRVELFHLDRVVEDTAQLLDHLGIKQAFIVGHDYSALVLHKFVRKHRDRVIRAAIINPITPGFEGRYLSPGHFPESWYSQFHQLDMAVDLVSSSRDACRIYFRHFLNHWSHDKGLFQGEELEIYVDNFMKPGNIHGGFNFYRANLSITSQPWTQLDRTISDCPVTFLQGMGDPVVPSVWTDLVTPWYSRYTIDYVQDGGHFLMREKPGYVNTHLKNAFLT